MVHVESSFEEITLHVAKMEMLKNFTKNICPNTETRDDSLLNIVERVHMMVVILQPSINNINYKFGKE